MTDAQELLARMGHKPTCDRSACTCESEIQAMLRQSAQLIADRVDAEALEIVYQRVLEKLERT